MILPWTVAQALWAALHSSRSGDGRYPASPRILSRRAAGAPQPAKEREGVPGALSKKNNRDTGVPYL